VHKLNPKARLFSTRSSSALLRILRDKNTPCREFAKAADRLCHLLGEEALASIVEDESPTKIETPCGIAMIATRFVNEEDIVIVDIMRSGAILAERIRNLVPGAATAKILIQRNEETAEPILMYSKLPNNLEHRYILLADPMLATGGSACKAIEVLVHAGARQENIFFANVITCPQGLQRLAKEAPNVRILTMAIDDCLNERAYICPGLGDFGDRFYGTC